MLKDSILQLFKCVAPKVYQYRFNENFVTKAASNYLEGTHDGLIDMMFEADDGNMDRVESEEEDEPEHEEDQSQLN